MGTHGRSGFNRWMLGSVTERILRESPVPLLTVRGAPRGQVRRILSPIDGTEAGDQYVKARLIRRGQQCSVSQTGEARIAAGLALVTSEVMTEPLVQALIEAFNGWRARIPSLLPKLAVPAPG
jgi:hypothetical protein